MFALPGMAEKTLSGPSIWTKLATKNSHFYSEINKDDIESGAQLVDDKAFAFLSVTIRPPFTLSNILALTYSFLPYALFVVYFVWFVCTEHFFPFYAMILTVVGSTMCEVLFKNFFKERRPERSVVHSYGMPSSHCLSSFAVFVWILLEVCIAKLSIMWRLLYLLTNIALYAPVPWARWYLEDHSYKQCVAGCSGGVILGVAAFFIRFQIIPAGMAIIADLS
eukprot:GDKI01018898.1.p1 GENE.GDKI01018898.1~~GDKI01018898.1.p1  ORF type:complete len:222 (-),score=35.56 GDKI01018898.1:312-977(-)